jgi:hypothetical protein
MAFQVEHELHKRRLGRNIGLGVVLAVFVGLVFGLTVVKVTGISANQGVDAAMKAETNGGAAKP